MASQLEQNFSSRKFVKVIKGIWSMNCYLQTKIFSSVIEKLLPITRTHRVCDKIYKYAWWQKPAVAQHTIKWKRMKNFYFVRHAVSDNQHMIPYFLFLSLSLRAFASSPFFEHTGAAAVHTFFLHFVRTPTRMMMADEQRVRGFWIRLYASVKRKPREKKGKQVYTILICLLDHIHCQPSSENWLFPLSSCSYWFRSGWESFFYKLISQGLVDGISQCLLIHFDWIFKLRRWC